MEIENIQTGYMIVDETKSKVISKGIVESRGFDLSPCDCFYWCLYPCDGFMFDEDLVSKYRTPMELYPYLTTQGYCEFTEESLEKARFVKVTSYKKMTFEV